MSGGQRFAAALALALARRKSGAGGNLMVVDEGRARAGGETGGETGGGAGGGAGTLRPVAQPPSPTDVQLITRWRNEAGAWFFSRFTATAPRTRAWLQREVHARPDRILFMIESPSGAPLGHIGLARVDPAPRSIEVDNMLRGETGVWPGGMARAARRLFAWAFGELGCRRITGRLFADNARSLEHHLRLGFRIVDRAALRCRVEADGGLRWVAAGRRPPRGPEREMLTIALERPRAPRRQTAASAGGAGAR